MLSLLASLSSLSSQIMRRCPFVAHPFLFGAQRFLHLLHQPHRLLQQSACIGQMRPLLAAFAQGQGQRFGESIPLCFFRGEEMVKVGDDLAV